MTILSNEEADAENNEGNGSNIPSITEVIATEIVVSSSPTENQLDVANSTQENSTFNTDVDGTGTTSPVEESKAIVTTKNFSFPVLPSSPGFHEAYEVVKQSLPMNRINALYPRMAAGFENGIAFIKY